MDGSETRVSRLSAELRSVTDRLEQLWEQGPPSKGRSADDQEAAAGWHEDTGLLIQNARAALSDITLLEQQAIDALSVQPARDVGAGEDQGALQPSASVPTEGPQAAVVVFPREATEEMLLASGMLDPESRELARSLWRDMAKAACSSEALSDIATERQRQVQQEGWSDVHDDSHDDYELSRAASCYALAPYQRTNVDGPPSGEYWPWEQSWWRPRNDRGDLIRAAALIVAEIERLDRAALTASSPNALAQDFGSSLRDTQPGAEGAVVDDDELIERSFRTVQAYDAVRLLRDALHATSIRVTGYDWNADPEGLTKQQGDALALADKVFADLNKAVADIEMDDADFEPNAPAIAEGGDL